MIRPVRPAGRAAPMIMALALVLALVMSGCSGSSDKPDANQPSTTGGSTSAAKVPHVVTKVTLGKVTGRLPRRDATVLESRIGKVVDGWFEAAYLAGRYPRSDFHNAFPFFTAGARAQARTDATLMSNQDIGKQISSVTVTKRRVRVDVLAVRRVAVAVTALVVLEFRTAGHLHKSLRVQGRLFLTRDAKQPSGWSIFGYDMTKGGTR